MLPFTRGTVISVPSCNRETNSKAQALVECGQQAMEQSMPSGGKTHIGSGAHGKGAGNGALTDIPKDKVGDNMILSNRDKAQHSDIRGMDGKFIQTEQYQDHSANRLAEDEEE
jgi:hypothetical protein